MSDLRPRHRGRPRPRPPPPREGRDALLRAVAGRACSTARAASDEADGGAADHDASTGAAGWPTASFPDHRWREHLQRSRARPEGPDLRADRRDGRRRRRPRCPRRRAASATGTTASPGCATRPSRCSGLHSLGPELGGRRLHPVRRRRRAQRRRLRCRSCTGSAASASCAEQTLDHLTGYEGAAPGAGRQRRLSTSARTTSSARCSTRSTCTPRSTATTRQRLWPVIEDQVELRDRRPGGCPTRASGRPAASPSTTSSASSCAGSRWTAARAWPRGAARTTLADEWREVANEIHAEICERGVDERGVFTQHYEHRRAGRLAAADPARPLPPPRRRARRAAPSWRSPTS